MSIRCISTLQVSIGIYDRYDRYFRYVVCLVEYEANLRYDLSRCDADVMRVVCVPCVPCAMGPCYLKVPQAIAHSWRNRSEKVSQPENVLFAKPNVNRSNSDDF